MSEETHNAAIAAPLGVITSVGGAALSRLPFVCVILIRRTGAASAIFGFFLLLSFLFSIQGDIMDTIIPSSGQPVLQIFIQVFGQTGATIGQSCPAIATPIDLTPSALYAQRCLL